MKKKKTAQVKSRTAPRHRPSKPVGYAAKSATRTVKAREMVAHRGAQRAAP